MKKEGRHCCEVGTVKKTLQIGTAKKTLLIGEEEVGPEGHVSVTQKRGVRAKRERLAKRKIRCDFKLRGTNILPLLRLFQMRTEEKVTGTTKIEGRCMSPSFLRFKSRPREERHGINPPQKDSKYSDAWLISFFQLVMIPMSCRVGGGKAPQKTRKYD